MFLSFFLPLSIRLRSLWCSLGVCWRRRSSTDMVFLRGTLSFQGSGTRLSESALRGKRFTSDSGDVSPLSWSRSTDPEREKQTPLVITDTQRERKHRRMRIGPKLASQKHTFWSVCSFKIKDSYTHKNIFRPKFRMCLFELHINFPYIWF